MRAASLACAAGVLLAVVLADLLPDIWRDLPGAGLPWWAPAGALVAGVAAADALARRGCACRSAAGHSRADDEDTRDGTAGDRETGSG